MTDIDSTLKTLRDRISAAQAKKARAQAEYERAEADRARAVEELAAFGVTTPEEGAALLKKLEDDLAKALADAEAALTEAGA